MEGDFIKINRWLLPLSWCYGMVVRLRNMLFDMGVLKSRAFSVPVISVGNITVGGTGKTPHVEYLIKLLQDVGRVAVLSRGYKRDTRGFVMADDTATARSIGDEPMQIKKNFPKAIVAVDGNRVRGIRRLLEQVPDIDVIVLDDAFQHRYVKPGINILLVDYHRLIIYDRLLPAGRMREPLNGKNRADMVIVTKCPKELKPMEYRVLTKAMDLFPYQSLFFTTFDYSPLSPVFGSSDGASPATEAPGGETRGGGVHTLSSLAGYNVLLLTGIASPRQLKEDLEKLSSNSTRVVTLSFPDHHRFRSKDVSRINSRFEALPQPRCIVTTEKDAARLREAEGLTREVRRSMYELPVHVSFMLEQEQEFSDYIMGYVRRNSRHSILTKSIEKQKTEKPGTIRFRD